MEYLAVDRDGMECRFSSHKPFRNSIHGVWDDGISQPEIMAAGTIEKITGQRIVWSDEPIRIGE